MADAKFEEVIRLAFETGGTEGIKQAAGIMANLGDVSEATRAQAASLLDTISQAEKTERAVEQYRQLGLGVVDYQRQITEAKAKVVELAEALKQTDSPSKAQQRELEKARSSVSGLVAAQQKQLVQLRDLKGQIEGQGISLRSVGSAQQQVAARTAEASAALRTMATRLRDERASEQAFQSELATATAKSRTEAKQFDDALKRVQHQLDENKRAAKEGSKEMGEGLEHTRGLLERLREPLAAVAAFFSFEALKEGVKSIFETGSAFEKFEQQLGGLYGNAAKGKEAFEWVKQFTTQTPLKLDETMSAFVRLKKFGIDPMGGALQAVVDQNARLGGSADNLEAITTALAKATAKGRLEMRGLIQLTEAGVPAFDILAEVTGKTADEVRMLAENGRIGADVMQKFIAQMGKDAAGAAAKELEQLSSQWTVFTENIDDFRDRIARKGVMDYFRDQLQEVNAFIGRMAADGRLDRYAKAISDALVTAGKAVRSATTWLYEHASAIGQVAQIYATFKVARLVTELGLAGARLIENTRAALSAGEAMAGTARKVGLLGRALARIPASVQIAVAVVGFELLKKTGEYLGEFAGKHSAAAKALEESQARLNAAMRRQAESFMVVEQQYSRFADVQVQSVAEVAKLTEAERESYRVRLEGLQAYLKARLSEQLRLQQLGEATEEDLAKTRKAFQDAKAGMDTLQQGAELAANALRNKISLGAEDVRKQLVGLGNDATTAQARIAELFQSFQSASITDIGDIALALAHIADESQKADQAVRIGLQGTLASLSSTDLLKFQSSATAAFAQFKLGARDAAAVTDTVLQVALERLGVAADRWGLSSTDAARQNVAAFQTVAENASATASTIEAAFNKAVANATTIESVKDLGTAMQAAGEQGRLGFGATDRAVATVQDRIRQLQTSLDPLNAAFERLGIRSKRSLDDAAAAARSSFAAISAAYRNGGAAIEDVRAAFGAYARTQLDAVANADEWQQSAVRSALQVQAATLNVSDEMARLGLAGLDTGNKVAQGAHVAAAALDQTAKAADAAATSTKDYGEAVKDAGNDSNAAQRKFTPAAVALNGLSDSMLKALEALNAYASSPKMWGEMWNGIFAVWQHQKDQYAEQMAMIDHQNAAFDEMGKRVEELRKVYGYLNDDALRAMAQAQKTLEDNQRKAKEQAEAKAREARQAREEAIRQAQEDADAQTAAWRKELGMDDKASGAPSATPQRIAIDLTVAASQTSGAVPAQLSGADVQKVANEVVRQIGIARARSN